MSRSDELLLRSAQAIKNSCIARSLRDASNQKRMVASLNGFHDRRAWLVTKSKPTVTK